jgi:hypothetical protein
MIVINQRQIDTLSEESDANFAALSVDFLRRTLGTKVEAFTDAELRAHARTALQRCRSYGVETTPAILQFLTLMVLISPDFDSVPAVHRLLVAPGLHAHFKVELLVQMLARYLQDQAD